MWRMLNKSCKQLRDRLEEAAAKLEDTISVETLTAGLPDEERKHIASCAACREALNDLVQVKELLQGAASFAAEDDTWFAKRVMAAIASREKDLAERVTAWTEFPRLASRLAWVATILLLAGTTWFYESVVRTPAYTPAGSQESIFEVPQQTSPDDVLVSMAGDHP